MLYQVSRSGQVYGPYTLEDLQRYLASGNVLPTDLTKSEEMTDWVPVSQIMSGETAAPVSGFQGGGFANPTETSYMPAAAPMEALAASPYPDPPNLHWGLYTLFAIVSVLFFLLFSRIFTLVQAVWLRRVQPNSNALFAYLALYVLIIFESFRAAAMVMAMFAHPGIISAAGFHGGLFFLVHMALLIVCRFMMSASLEEHFNGPEPIGLRLNPVMVFFFGGIYFQYHLNRINAIKQAARLGMGRGY